jgi:uncharacterized protein (DUF58 family)
MKWFKQLYLNNFFFYVAMAIIVLFVVANFVPAIYNATWLVLYIFLGFTIIDFLLLFATNQRFSATRIVPEKLSNGDENPIEIKIESGYAFAAKLKVIDEIPFQLQVRDFGIIRNISAGGTDKFGYSIRPVERGEYYFGSLNVYVSSPLRLISRRFRFDNGQMVPTYPSFIQLRKYDLMAFSNKLFQYGLKKIRRIGHTMNLSRSRTM